MFLLLQGLGWGGWGGGLKDTLLGIKGSNASICEKNVKLLDKFLYLTLQLKLTMHCAK